MRPLTFSDDKDEEQKWLPGGPQSAVDAFLEFVARHRDVDNTSFGIEDEENEEALLFMFEVGAICRIRWGQNSRNEYRVVTNRGDYRTQASYFVRGGFTALDRHGPWMPDVDSFKRARSAHLRQRAARDAHRGQEAPGGVRDQRGEELRSQFDGSVLRRTHPRELRRRLEVLTYVDGREPTTVAGVTHCGFGNGGGETVNAWFAADGRGLVVTFDHTSALNSSDDARAQAALYDGVPADLLDLVRDVPEADTTLGVSHPDGGTLVAATGIFTFSGPCAMADGLVSRLTEARLGVEDTGVGWLVEGFLAMEDFTPAAVAEAVKWWSAEDIARGFAATAALDHERSATAPLDREAADRFCRIWADAGYNDRWGVHYVLFDSRTLEEAGEDREELLRLIQTLGLERVDAPPGAATGEVWVRTDPRIDAELEHWS
ncbi:DUF6357 family protein [Actinophytocola algeriensis]|uniref:Uncharacterized protein n=1 Tax=Actinophytocola algeriensis TaxID=1768010 RepID=A0A7W7VDE8_9PSEU|nr:hypothetical protein [Actinophytocola algeriensis]MBE1472405.1 hypothetical protein [Actinophytocola algeriensis]